MATKTTIQNLINSNLASGSNITASEHRAVLSTVLNELFPASENFIVTTGDIQYNLTFTKSGNFCNISGTFANGSEEIIGGINLLNIPNSIYFPKKNIFFLGFTHSYEQVRLVVSDGTFSPPNAIFLEGSLPIASILDFNITYIVND